MSWLRAAAAVAWRGARAGRYGSGARNSYFLPNSFSTAYKTSATFTGAVSSGTGRVLGTASTDRERKKERKKKK